MPIAETRDKFAAARENLAIDKEYRDRWIGVYVGILAMLLALCTMGGGNATKDANRLNIEAANNWNFFQAKNLRRYSFIIAADDMELRLKSEANLTPEGRKAVEEKIASYRTSVQTLSNDPKSNEGLDQLWEKGKALEKERDVMFKKDPYFDWSQAALQIAIVLASVCLITGQLWSLMASFGLAVMGIFMMVDGYTLFLPLAFVG